MKMGTEELKDALNKLETGGGLYRRLAIKLLLSKNEVYTTDPELKGLTQKDIMKIGIILNAIAIELEIED